MHRSSWTATATATGAALLALVLSSCGGATGPSPSQDGPAHAVPVALDAGPYAVVGPATMVVLVPVGGGCSTAGAPEVEVEQTSTRVVLRAAVRPGPAPPPAADCPSVLRTSPVTVELDAPVGDRTVWDGVGRRVLPPGAWPGLTG